MIKTMWDCMDWRKPLLINVDLLKIVEIVIVALSTNEPRSSEITKRG
jgi:hypothetical protein